MKTKDLNKVADTKGTKKSVGTSAQIENSIKMECDNVSKKVVYLRPNSESKIDDFYKYFTQENSRQFEVNNLFVAIRAKYSSQFGHEFVDALIDDLDNFTKHFTCDIVTKVENGIDYSDITYRKGDSDITRYLVSVDNGSVCSIFRHFMDYAKSSNRISVAAIVAEEKKASDIKRKENTEKRREEKETKKVGEKVSNLSIDKLLAMLTPDQIAAIKSA